MTEPKFNIRPFDPSKPAKRQRHSDPPPPTPMDEAGWKRLDKMRWHLDILRRDLNDSAPTAANIGDPVISRALLTIHRALQRIERRAFIPSVAYALRKQAKDDGGST